MATKYIVQGKPSECKDIVKDNIGKVFLESMKKHCDNIAQIDPTTQCSETHGSLRLRSIRVAMELANRGVVEGDVVVICSLLTLDQVVPMLASIYLGAAVFPLHPALSETDLGILIKRGHPKIIFTDKSCSELLASICGRLGFVAEIVTFGQEGTFGEFLAEKPGEESFEPTSVDTVKCTALIVGSSGTTGPVKGVIVNQNGYYTTLIENTHRGFKLDTILAYSPLSWISALCMIGLTIMAGTRRIVTEYVPEQTLPIIQNYKVTFGLFTPQKMLEMVRNPEFKNYDVSSFHTVLVGGSGSSLERLEEYDRAFPNTNVLHVYGMTEVMSGLSMFLIEGEEAKLIKEKRASVGRLIGGARVKIIDSDSGKSLPVNNSGEICIQKNTLTTGYYNDPEATAATIDADGWFHTGDLGYFDEDDCLYFVGRNKEVLKYRGWSIQPCDLESLLLQYPGVLSAAVIGISHETDGDHPVAFIVKDANTPITEQQIIRYMEQNVRDYQRLRGGVRFIDALPLTPSGKVRRLELKKLL